MSRLPSYQWYPGDWRKDPAVQSLGYFERGVWRELLDFMHEAEERGKLKVNGRWLDDESVARLLGIGSKEWEQTRSKLEAAGVPGVDPESRGIFSKRMVRDEAKRLAKVEAGRLGGLRSRPEASRKQTRSKSEAKPGSKTEANGGSTARYTSVSKRRKEKEKKKAAVENSTSEQETRAKLKAQLEAVGRASNPPSETDDLPTI